MGEKVTSDKRCQQNFGKWNLEGPLEMTSATAVSTLLNAHGVWEDNWKVGWFVLERIQKWFRNWRLDGAVDSVHKE